jgi:hypothetical protein
VAQHLQKTSNRNSHNKWSKGPSLEQKDAGHLGDRCTFCKDIDILSRVVFGRVRQQIGIARSC